VFGTLDEGGAQRQFAGVQIRGIGGRWKRSLRCKTVSDHRVIPRFSERLGGSALIFQDLDLGEPEIITFGQNLGLGFRVFK
jgi:hypothetical protein